MWVLVSYFLVTFFIKQLPSTPPPGEDEESKAFELDDDGIMLIYVDRVSNGNINNGDQDDTSLVSTTIPPLEPIIIIIIYQ